MSEYKYNLWSVDENNRPGLDGTPRNADGLTEEQVEELSQVHQHLQSTEEGAWPLRRVHFPATFAEPEPEGKLGESEQIALQEAFHALNKTKYILRAAAIKSAFPEAFVDEGEKDTAALSRIAKAAYGYPQARERCESLEWRVPKPGETFIDNEGTMIDPALAPGETVNYKCWVLRRAGT